MELISRTQLPYSQNRLNRISSDTGHQIISPRLFARENSTTGE